MLDKMKQLMEMKRQAEQIKKELERTQIDVSETSGIKLTVNGAQHFQSLEIDEHLLSSQNKRKLEADLLRSLNAAIAKSQAVAADKMKEMTGLNIPGF